MACSVDRAVPARVRRGQKILRRSFFIEGRSDFAASGLPRAALYLPLSASRGSPQFTATRRGHHRIGRLLGGPRTPPISGPPRQRLASATAPPPAIGPPSMCQPPLQKAT